MNDERKRIFSIRVREVGEIFSSKQVERENKQPHETKYLNIEEPIIGLISGWYKQGETYYSPHSILSVTYYK